MKWFAASIFLLMTVSSLPAALISQHIGKTGTDWEGNVRLDRDLRRVIVHEQYLEIEEEVELSAITLNNQIPGKTLQNGLKITGTFDLPSGSVLSGAVLWDGNKLLKAKLKTKSDSFNEYVDSTDSTSEWKPSSTDPMMISLNKRGEVDIYNFDLVAVKWGETRRLRIRYLEPIKYGNEFGATMVLRGAFAGSVDVAPKDFTLELKGAPGITSVKLKNSNVTNQHTLSDSPVAMILPYEGNSNLSITHADLGKGGKMYTTRIDTGELAGEYLHYFSEIPEELYKNAGLKRQVVFLWRWENENSLVQWQNQTKSLTPYGEKALAEAYDINRCMAKLFDQNAGVALYHDRTGAVPDTLFGMSNRGSDTAKALMNYMDYLSRNSGENILGSIAGFEVKNEQEGEVLTGDELDSICKSGRDDFKIAIDSIKTMFSPDEKIIKHIVLITAGKRKTDEPKTFIANLSGLDNVTFSGYGIDSRYPDGYWPGIDLSKIMNSHKIVDGGEVVDGYRVPKNQSAHFTVYLKSTKKTTGFSVDNIGSTGTTDFRSLSFTGHAAEVWNDTVVWQAVDDQGKKVGTYSQVPSRIKTVNDTDLIMLWGGSSTNPYSETIKSGSIGYLVGFVDEKYSLLAMPYDSVSAALKKKIEAGGEIPNLGRDEIFGPKVGIISDATKTARIGINSIISIANTIHLSLNIGNSTQAQLVIYDLQGRIIKRFTCDQLMGKSEIIWESKEIATGFYIARLVLNGTTVTSMKFTI